MGGEALVPLLDLVNAAPVLATNTSVAEPISDGGGFELRGLAGRPHMPGGELLWSYQRAAGSKGNDIFVREYGVILPGNPVTVPCLSKEVEAALQVRLAAAGVLGHSD